MKLVVIGGTGHIGTYLVPRLVTAGHEVIVVTRGKQKPYHDHPTWQSVKRVEIDRQAAEKDGTFGQSIRDLKPDVVMDLICFRQESASHLVEALRGQIQQFINVGTIWVHGYSIEVPTTEDQIREPFGEYGINKYKTELYLLEQARRYGFPATILHPGHIVGAGWPPVGPTACFDMDTFARLARGDEVSLPNLGMETLHHVHADDVAQAFVKAMTHWSNAVGESFYVVSPAALTLRGYAEAVAKWFGKKANLQFLPLEQWKKTVPEQHAGVALAHIEHSSSLLDYRQRYTSLEAIFESISWLIEHGQLR